MTATPGPEEAGPPLGPGSVLEADAVPTQVKFGERSLSERTRGAATRQDARGRPARQRLGSIP
ncbi:hypothetical protein Sfulv_57790 [Streptomyces fulvorobeus]|uniref:Uncharacterized protein n=1 Tax=Streptomyces fulvorobeus TaxID=284028 RepID=A0A7J0CEY4_9ACTN|nr:hypothetical protein Sfulv_57790 [Streptomyces fulvorobeus]